MKGLVVNHIQLWVDIVLILAGRRTPLLCEVLATWTDRIKRLSLIILT
jgi:hypothetical protein